MSPEELMMPEMNGFEFVEQLRKDPQAEHIPVIVFTAMDLDDEDRARLHGDVQETIQKRGQTPRDLVAIIRSVVTTHRASLAPPRLPEA